MKRLAPISLFLLAALAAAAPGSGSFGRAARSGLYGNVTMGPLMPVCREGVPCDGPARHERLLFVRNRHVVARTRTSQTGTYRISLPAGRYTIRSKIGFGVVKPPSITVPRGRFRRVDLSLDTGIR